VDDSAIIQVIVNGKGNRSMMLPSTTQSSRSSGWWWVGYGSGEQSVSYSMSTQRMCEINDHVSPLGRGTPLRGHTRLDTPPPS
jgi:hypothetical protein